MADGHVLPALKGTQDASFFAQLTGEEVDAEPNSTFVLLRMLFAFFSGPGGIDIPGGWDAFCKLARRAILTSEITATVNFKDGGDGGGGEGEGGWDDEGGAGDKDDELGDEDGGGAGGGGGGGGGGGEDHTAVSTAAALYAEIVKDPSTREGDSSWAIPPYPTFDGFFTPKVLADDFRFGRQPKKYWTMGPQQAPLAKDQATSLHAIMLAASKCYAWLLPLNEPCPYDTERSNFSVNNFCLNLYDAPGFVERLSKFLPLGVALCPHGHKGLVPAAKPNVTDADLDFNEVFCGLRPHQRPYSVAFFATISDALNFTSLLNLNVLPNGRANWDLDGLGGKTCAGARAVVFIWLHLLLAFGVDHALVVTAKVRRLLVHVALCVCDKVASRKHRFTRTGPDGAPQSIIVQCLYIQLHGVSGAPRAPTPCVLRFPFSPPRRPTPTRSHMLQRGLTLTLENHVSSMATPDDVNKMAASMAWFRTLSTKTHPRAEDWHRRMESVD
jgi:hypothetical protein